jgi:hypothetical protein
MDRTQPAVRFRCGGDKGIENRSGGFEAHAVADPDIHPTYRRPTGQGANFSLFDDARDLGTHLRRVYEPGWIRDSLRFMTHSIESLADRVPEPWGARLEIMLRELGGMIWIQIATAIVLLRLIIWVPFHVWRLRRGRRLVSAPD